MKMKEKRKTERICRKNLSSKMKLCRKKNLSVAIQIYTNKLIMNFISVLYKNMLFIQRGDIQRSKISISLSLSGL